MSNSKHSLGFLFLSFLQQFLQITRGTNRNHLGHIKALWLCQNACDITVFENKHCWEYHRNWVTLTDKKKQIKTKHNAFACKNIKQSMWIVSLPEWSHGQCLVMRVSVFQLSFLSSKQKQRFYPHAAGLSRPKMQKPRRQKAQLTTSCVCSPTLWRWIVC